MARRRARKWGLVTLVGALLLVVGGVVGVRIALERLRSEVTGALGPGSELRALRVDWTALEVEGLRIKAGEGWPAPDAVRADRIRIVPRLESLLSGRLEVPSVTVVRPYISALRSSDWDLQVVPGLLSGNPATGEGTAIGLPTRSVAIWRIILEDGVVELFDATVAQPPVRIRLERIAGTVRDIVAPTLSGRSPFEVTAVMKGEQRDGRLNLSGWIDTATRNASVTVELRSADLVSLQPYLVEPGEARVRGGSLDLDLRWEVRENRLRAPGRIAISDLEFAPARDALDTFMGIPRAMVLTFLEDEERRIEVRFVLDGDIDDPDFTLNEAVATRIASAAAEKLGVSIKGVVKGIGGLGRKGLETAGGAARSVGEALRQLLGDPPPGPVTVEPDRAHGIRR